MRITMQLKVLIDSGFANKLIINDQYKILIPSVQSILSYICTWTCYKRVKCNCYLFVVPTFNQAKTTVK